MFEPRPHELLTPHTNDCTEDPDLYGNHTIARCPDPTGLWTASILLTVYVLIMNVLLINLLIAIFNDVISSKEVTKAHWSFQRYKLICEFHSKWSPLVPPFSFLYYFFCACMFVVRKRRKLLKKLYFRVAMRVCFALVDDQKLKARMRAIRDQYAVRLEQLFNETAGLTYLLKASDEQSTSLSALRSKLDHIQKQVAALHNSRKPSV